MARVKRTQRAKSKRKVAAPPAPAEPVEMNTMDDASIADESLFVDDSILVSDNQASALGGEVPSADEEEDILLVPPAIVADKVEEPSETVAQEEPTKGNDEVAFIGDVLSLSQDTTPPGDEEEDNVEEAVAATAGPTDAMKKIIDDYSVGGTTADGTDEAYSAGMTNAAEIDETESSQIDSTLEVDTIGGDTDIAYSAGMTNDLEIGTPVKDRKLASPTHTEPESPDKTDKSMEDEHERKGALTVRRCYMLSICLLCVAICVIVPLAVILSTGSGSPSPDPTSASSQDTNVPEPSVPDVAPVRTTAAPTKPPTLSPTHSPTMVPTTSSPSTIPSSVPSMVPVPTASPTTGVPTTSPTKDPTTSPSSTPTKSPTASPTTAAPTPSPTVTAMPSRAGLDLMPIISTAVRDPTLLLGATTQARAMHWMENDDRIGELSIERTIQRFALTTLDFATHGQVATVASPWTNECDWQGVTCINGTALVEKVVWANQNLTGSLPDEIGLLVNCTHFDLAENEISGKLPEGLYDMVNLETLYMHQNRISGSMSERFAEMPNLLHVYLGQNQLTGPIPQGLGSGRGRGIRRLSTSCNVGFYRVLACLTLLVQSTSVYIRTGSVVAFRTTSTGASSSTSILASTRSQVRFRTIGARIWSGFATCSSTTTS